MTTQDAAGSTARFRTPQRRAATPARSAASARERLSNRLDERLNDPSRRAPRAFLHVISRIHRLIPRALRERVPVTFVGYALINGSAFLIDISLLWFFYDGLHWFYPLAVSLGYMIARGHLAAQGSRYAIGLVSQYVIFILGLSSFLHWIGVQAELARFISACCEGLYLYALMRLWVFRGTPEPDDDEPSAPATA